MTVVPLPESPCVRARLIYTVNDGSEASSRFYLSYSGGAPSAANCATLASDIAAAWATHLAPNIGSDWSLTEVDVLDIATNSGLSGTAAVSTPGGISSNPIPAQVAVNVEFDIARRYRGGKPRMFLPPPTNAQTVDVAHWTAAYVTAVDTGVLAWATEIEALSVGSMGSLQHVNLSYYEGFTNVTNSSGRTRAAPKYRDAAKLDTITAYSAKQTMGSQRRRRVSTTP